MSGSTITLVTLEDASLAADARSVVGATEEQGRMLAHVGRAAAECLHDLFRDATADELRSRATRLRGAALHALLLAAELHSNAGRLEQIASVREAAVPDGEG